MARDLRPNELRNAKAIAERVVSSGEIYKGEELLAEAVLFLLEDKQRLEAEIKERADL